MHKRVTTRLSMQSQSSSWQIIFLTFITVISDIVNAELCPCHWLRRTSESLPDHWCSADAWEICKSMCLQYSVFQIDHWIWLVRYVGQFASCTYVGSTGQLNVQGYVWWWMYPSSSSARINCNFGTVTSAEYTVLEIEIERPLNNNVQYLMLKLWRQWRVLFLLITVLCFWVQSTFYSLANGWWENNLLESLAVSRVCLYVCSDLHRAYQGLYRVFN